MTGPSRVPDRTAGTPGSTHGALPVPVLRLRLAALLAAQLFDYATFTIMVERYGIRTELNPIVAHGFLAFGLPIVALVKLALVVLVGSVIILLGRDPSPRVATRYLATFVTLAAVVGGLIGGISNVMAR
jgi:hypothetical protein